MSGRHSGGTTGGLRIAALPKTLRLIFQLAPRQLTDEIALARIEIKRKGIALGVAAAFLAVALVFVAFLIIGLIVAAIMGLATIMPAWLAALLACGVFLLVALIVGLIGYRKFKKTMPLVPQETLRNLKYDLGIAKEGSGFDPAVLDPSSEQAKAAKAAKAEAAAKEKAEKEAKAAAGPDYGPPPTEDELRRRLDQRRSHLAVVRDELEQELDIKTQAQALLGAARVRIQAGREQLEGTVARFRSPARNADTAGAAGQLRQRWKPLVAFTAATAAVVYLLHKLTKG